MISDIDAASGALRHAKAEVAKAEQAEDRYSTEGQRRLKAAYIAFNDACSHRRLVRESLISTHTNV